MVAISILSLAITGPLVIAQKGIASAIYSRDQITASYLAQEAVEYIRNTRDTNKISGSAWLDGFDLCLSTPSVPASCRIDARYVSVRDSTGTPTAAVAGCVTGTCPRISLDKATGIYGYDNSTGWTQTAFTRSISITKLGSDDKEAVVSINVSWSTNLFSPQKQFAVKEILFNI